MKNIIFFIFTIILGANSVAIAGEDYRGRFIETVGVRGGIALGDGEPSNDANQGEIYVRRNFNGFMEGLNGDVYFTYSTFDFENPASTVLGLPGVQTPPNDPTKVYDATGTIYELGIRAEKVFPAFNKRFEWFVAGGLGIGRYSAGTLTKTFPDDNNAATTDSINISVKSGYEFVPRVEAGMRYEFFDGWTGEFGIKETYHTAGWEVTDSVSGTTGKVSGYDEFGVFLGIQYDIFK